LVSVAVAIFAALGPNSVRPLPETVVRGNQSKNFVTRTR
jgi:hypothetical protein